MRSWVSAALCSTAVACADPQTKSTPSRLDVGGGGSYVTSSGVTTITTLGGATAVTTTGEASGSGGSSGGSAATGSGGSSGGAGGEGGDAASGGTGGAADPCGNAGAGSEPQSGDELFFDDFSNGSDAWESSEGTTWGIVWDDDAMSDTLGNGTIVNKPRVAYLSGACFTDVVVEARVKVLDFPGSSTTYVAGACLRVESDNDFYLVGVQGNGNGGLVRVSNGSPSSLDSDSSVELSEDQWYSVRFEAVGSELTGFIDGELVVDHVDAQHRFGSLGVCTINADAVFDDVRVTVP
jgi:hypothetical protein